ncbi:MAG TPA: (2Fe-2S)-binding protein [Gammaproteobacteria bacterium]|nr:(2Fe-2S)-binding protein [Gammaproteobacteria bacterium]
MFVCVCNNISERKIHEAAAQGVRTLDELSNHLGVATGCGTCAEFARECLEEALDENNASAPLPQPA